MKPHEAEAPANALRCVAEEMPRFRGGPSAVFTRVRYFIAPDYLDAPWLTDTQSFVNQLRTGELEAAIAQCLAACWLGADGQCRLILLDLPRSKEEAKGWVNEPHKPGFVCRLCGMEEDQDELEPGRMGSTAFFIHKRCIPAWNDWRRAAA